MKGTHRVAKQRLIVQNSTKKIHDLNEAGNTQIPHEVGLTLLWAEWSRHKEGPPLSSHHWKKQLFDWSVRDVHTTAREDLSKLRFGSD